MCLCASTCGLVLFTATDIMYSIMTNTKWQNNSKRVRAISRRCHSSSDFRFARPSSPWIFEKTIAQPGAATAIPTTSHIVIEMYLLLVSMTLQPPSFALSLCIFRSNNYPFSHQRSNTYISCASLSLPFRMRATHNVPFSFFALSLFVCTFSNFYSFTRTNTHTHTHILTFVLVSFYSFSLYSTPSGAHPNAPLV